VEDYQLQIDWPWDFGDAPQSYGTLRSDPQSGLEGAFHELANGVTSPRLGATVDGERNGQPGPAADGDDRNGSGDEDGVTFTTPLTAGLPATVSVDLSHSLAAGVLNAWIDFGGDGRWETFDGDQIIAGAVLLPGTVHELQFDVPPTLASGSAPQEVWGPGGRLQMAKSRITGCRLG
jgi:hypothetical protein